MIRISNTLKWQILLILLFVLLSSLVVASENNEENFSYINDSIFSDYGTVIFEDLENDPDMIAIRGTIPEIKNSEELKEWDAELRGHRENIGSLIEPYMTSNDGPVVALAYNSDGYMRVYLDKYLETEINDTTIDMLYQIIEEEYEQEGIDNVPVAFIFRYRAIETIEKETYLSGFSSLLCLLVIMCLIALKKYN
ncbi:hypothetical protein SAMN04488696_0983 [Methanolobus profundi]|uniref:Uncharacterized protein n=1 Tax=Methanolobus profundi TaxID=487685 RepID=A0A1I4PYC1_9EURY|nr:hypothetical protein SAMN04488696_0983 [Methanolobus profundi]